LSPAFAGPACASATCAKAWRSAGGSSFPRRAARRRIPAQALGLKQNRRSISPVSRIADKEHSLAPLRQSEPLRIQSCPLDKSRCPQSDSGISPAVSWNTKLGPSQLSNHLSKVAPVIDAE
jgi:hypothetical protein